MKNLTTIICALIAAGGAYLTASTAAKRDADTTQHEQEVASLTAQRDELAGEVADLRAELAAKTERRPKRVARGEVVQPPVPVTRTAEIQGALARADSAARDNPATAQLPRAGLATRVLRGLR